jgi:hypothetical protein
MIFSAKRVRLLRKPKLAELEASINTLTILGWELVGHVIPVFVPGYDDFPCYMATLTKDRHLGDQT